MIIEETETTEITTTVKDVATKTRKTKVTVSYTREELLSLLGLPSKAKLQAFGWKSAANDSDFRIVFWQDELK